MENIRIALNENEVNKFKKDLLEIRLRIITNKLDEIWDKQIRDYNVCDN